MNCPICCDVALVITQKNEIEIDYCPKCRGVWLDRGELEKIIQRTKAETTTINIPSIASQKEDDYEIIYDGPRDFDGDNRHYIRRKKPDLVLQEIFEFMD